MLADKALEERLRQALEDAQPWDDEVRVRTIDVKRLLYYVKKENSKPQNLIYRKDTCPTCRRKHGTNKRN